MASSELDQRCRALALQMMDHKQPFTSTEAVEACVSSYAKQIKEWRDNHEVSEIKDAIFSIFLFLISTYSQQKQEESSQFLNGTVRALLLFLQTAEALVSGTADSILALGDLVDLYTDLLEVSKRVC